MTIHAQVPEQIFVTDKLPKTATGKIQRRHMVTAFIKHDAGEPAAAQGHKPDEEDAGKVPSGPQPESKL